MATVRTEVAAGSGRTSTGGGGRLLLVTCLVVVTLLGTVIGLKVTHPSAGHDRAAAAAGPVYLHGRNLRGLDPIAPVYLHGRNLQGLDPIAPVYLHGRNLQGLDPIEASSA
jgi:hypothetical protein